MLDKSPTGQVGMGLGAATSLGTMGLLAPTIDITHTGQEETLDGVVIQFQITPGTECPAEMNFLFRQRGALCMAENATHNLHNLLTLRGAEVRDSRGWSRYLSEAIDEFSDQSDVAFASHHWPTWGKDNIVRFLSEQRDMYAYLHDQTLRRLNQGEIGSEIAEDMELSPELDEAWHTHGYYGSISHNVKAIYQRYLGWYDANPAHLWQHPPEAAAARYVEALGGIDATLAKASQYAKNGDLRFAAELASHAVFAAPDNAAARQVLADTLEQLGYGAECATWRNCYLVGAYELRNQIQPTALEASGLAGAMTITQLFDTISLRVCGLKAWGSHSSINWVFSDVDEHYRMELSRGALVHFPTQSTNDADLVVTLTKPQLLGVLATGSLDGTK